MIDLSLSVQIAISVSLLDDNQGGANAGRDGRGDLKDEGMGK